MKAKSFLVVAAALAVLVVGTVSAAGSSETKTSETKTISWMTMPVGTGDAFAKYKERLVADFEKKRPDIKVKLEEASWADGANKLMAAIIANSGPDIAHMGSWTTGQVFAAKGAMDLTDIYDKFGGIKAYIPSGKTLSTYKGRLYGVAWGGDARVYYIRTDMLKAAGIKPPTSNWKWSEFLNIAGGLKGVKGVKFPVGFIGAGDDLFFLWNAQVVANGGQIYTPDMKTATVNSTAGFKAIKNICDAVAKGFANPSVAEWDGNQVDAKFINGEIAIRIGPSGFTAAANKQGIEYMSITPPYTDEGGFGATTHLSVSSIMSYSKNKDAAVEFMAFFNSPQEQAAFNRVAGWIPARPDALQVDSYFQSDVMKGIAEGMAKGVCIMPENPQAINIKTIIQRSVNEVLTAIATGKPYNDDLLKKVLDRTQVDVQAELDRAAAGK